MLNDKMPKIGYARLYEKRDAVRKMMSIGRRGWSSGRIRGRLCAGTTSASRVPQASRGPRRSKARVTSWTARGVELETLAAAVGTASPRTAVTPCRLSQDPKSCWVERWVQVSTQATSWRTRSQARWISAEVFEVKSREQRIQQWAKVTGLTRQSGGIS